MLDCVLCDRRQVVFSFQLFYHLDAIVKKAVNFEICTNRFSMHAHDAYIYGTDEHILFSPFFHPVDNLNWQSHFFRVSISLSFHGCLLRFGSFFSLSNELRNAKLHFRCVETFFVLIGIVGVAYQVVGVIFRIYFLAAHNSMHKNAPSFGRVLCL